MKKEILQVKKLSVDVEGKNILRNVGFSISEGEIVGLTGANGSGKSSLALTLMGHPRYRVTGGKVEFLGKDLLAMKPEERAKNGLFLSFQNPSELSGVPFGKFLFVAYKENHGEITAKEFVAKLKEKCALLGIGQDFVERSVNEGFSGGEKKRAEILQLAVLEPKLAILDEADSGLDAEATKVVAGGIKRIAQKNPKMSIVVISHYEKFIKLMAPSRVLRMNGGKTGL
jgi:Fe-S cluster assembly ATP-binding protein